MRLANDVSLQKRQWPPHRHAILVAVNDRLAVRTPGTLIKAERVLLGARMRYDAPRLPATDRIGTVNLDILIPSRLPIASFLLALPRESRWRLFYDYGETFAPTTNTYRDAGVGFFLPFGGDVVGKPTMSFLKLSVLGVFYRSANGEVSRKPGVLVDLLGKL